MDVVEHDVGEVRSGGVSGIRVSAAARARRAWFGCPAAARTSASALCSQETSRGGRRRRWLLAALTSRTASGTRRPCRSHLATDLLGDISGQDRRDTRMQSMASRFALRGSAYPCEHKGRSGRLRSKRPEIRQSRDSGRHRMSAAVTGSGHRPAFCRLRGPPEPRGRGRRRPPNCARRTTESRRHSTGGSRGDASPKDDR